MDILFAFLLLLPITGVAAPEVETTPASLSVSVLDEAPFSELRTEGLVGCDSAYFRALARSSGLSVLVRSYPISRLIQKFKRQETDLIIIPATHPGQRPLAEGYHYWGPIFYMQDQLVTRDIPTQSDLAFLQGKRIGVAVNSCWALCQQLGSLPVDLVPIRTIEQGVRLLQSGRIDGVLAPDRLYQVALSHLRLAPETLRISYRAAPLPYYLAIAESLPTAQRQQLQQGYRQVGGNGGYMNICQSEMSRLWPQVKNHSH